MIGFTRAVLCSSLLCAAACPGPEPVYDEELDLQAVSVDPGAMAGTWAQKHSIVNVANLPLIGDQLAGGESYHLVKREVTDDGGYTQTTQVCGGRIYDTGGTSSFIEDEKWQLVPLITWQTVNIDDGLGTFDVKNHIELWSIDLPDPINDEMPADAEDANTEPHKSRIYDADNDGHLGTTMQLEGLAQGNVYFVQRKKVDFKGVIVAEDEVRGLIPDYKYEQITLGADNELLENQLERTEHPDPKQSWFQEIRTDDDADCDRVLQHVEDRDLERLNPFLAPE